MGGKTSAPPDYSAMAAATNRGIDVANALGNRQMDFAQRQYEEMKPLAQQVYQQQMAAQQQQMDQAKDYYNYQQSTFRPLEQGLVTQAQNYNTEGNRQLLAAQAAADAQAAFQGAQGQSNREMARRGINPSSGAALMLRNQNALSLAGLTAGSSNAARRQAEATGYARQMEAAGLGRGLAASSLSAYGGATAAGSTGLASAMAPGNQYSQAFGQGAGYMMGGAQMGIQGAGNILNAQTSAYNTGVNAQGEVMGSLIGAGTTAAFKFSDRRLKENIELVGRDERTMLPLYEFEYKNGSGKRYLGVMSDDVKERFPEMVTTMPDGYEAVDYAGLGIEMVEV
jgi:hypothetical protein